MLPLRDTAHELAVAIGERSSKVDHVFEEVNEVREAELPVPGVVVPRPQQIIGSVLNIGPRPMPGFGCSSELLEGQHCWLHSRGIEAVWIFHIDDVEFDEGAFGNVDHHEHEPLVVAVGIRIVLQNQVVLALSAVGCRRFHFKGFQ